jgi:TonB family protein
LAEVSDAATKDKVVELEEFDSTNQTATKNSFDSLLSFANAMPQRDLLRTIQGEVIDQKGNPLIGASIIETGTKNAVVTDVVGRFSIILEKLDNPLKVSYTGYQESKIPVSERGKYIEVIMFENEATLDEFAVEKTTKRSQKNVTSYDFILAKPVIGFKKFQKYIEQNAKYPDGYTSDNINGTVQVMFLLNEQGKPHTIEVTSSFNQAFNKEAIRLIREGTSWRTTPSGQTGQVVYNVEF